MDYPSLQDVLDRFNTGVAGLELLQRTGRSGVASPRFEQMSDQEFRAGVREARDELEGQAIVGLIGATEADLRLDLRARAERKTKSDPFRDPAIDLWRTWKGRPRLVDVIDFWQSGQAGSRLKQLLHLRHWLAHGRHFSEISGTPVDAPAAWARIDAFYRRIRTLDPHFPRHARP